MAFKREQNVLRFPSPKTGSGDGVAAFCLLTHRQEHIAGVTRISTVGIMRLILSDTGTLHELVAGLFLVQSTGTSIMFFLRMSTVFLVLA